MTATQPATQTRWRCTAGRAVPTGPSFSRPRLMTIYGTAATRTWTTVFRMISTETAKCVFMVIACRLLCLMPFSWVCFHGARLPVAMPNALFMVLACRLLCLMPFSWMCFHGARLPVAMPNALFIGVASWLSTQIGFNLFVSYHCLRSAMACAPPWSMTLIGLCPKSVTVQS